jgi:hypothetical protein
VMCDLYYNWINNNVIQPISVIWKTKVIQTL